MATITLPKGIFVTSEPPTAWHVNGRMVGPAKGCIYLQCSSDLETDVLCTNEIYIRAKSGYSTDRITNEQAAEIFKDNGWSISPTRCPECIAKGFTGGGK